MRVCQGDGKRGQGDGKRRPYPPCACHAGPGRRQASPLPSIRLPRGARATASVAPTLRYCPGAWRVCQGDGSVAPTLHAPATRVGATLAVALATCRRSRWQPAAGRAGNCRRSPWQPAAGRAGNVSPSPWQPAAGRAGNVSPSPWQPAAGRAGNVSPLFWQRVTVALATMNERLWYATTSTNRLSDRDGKS